MLMIQGIIVVSTYSLIIKLEIEAAGQENVVTVTKILHKKNTKSYYTTIYTPPKTGYTPIVAVS
jgi:hypothetical protein